MDYTHETLLIISNQFCPAWADFVVWVLEQSDVQSSPFDKHPPGPEKLSQLGLTSELWQDWVRRLSFRSVFGYASEFRLLSATEQQKRKEHELKHHTAYIKHLQELLKCREAQDNLTEEDLDEIECLKMMAVSPDSSSHQEDLNEALVTEALAWVEDTFGIPLSDLTSSRPIDYLLGSDDLKDAIHKMANQYTKRISLEMTYNLERIEDCCLYAVYNHCPAFQYEPIPNLPGKRILWSTLSTIS